MNKLEKAIIVIDEVLEIITDYTDWLAVAFLSLVIIASIGILGYFIGVGFYIGLAMGIMIGMIVLWLVIDSKFYLARKGK